MSSNPGLAAEVVIADLRDQVDQLAVKVSSQQGEIASGLALFAASKSDYARVVHERDRLEARNGLLEATHKLWAQTAAHLPVVGLTCDGDACAAAIGIVGVKMTSVDCIVEPALTIAKCAGWRTVTSEAGAKHYCRSCSEKL